jgi:hypothetical protein
MENYYYSIILVNAYIQLIIMQNGELLLVKKQRWQLPKEYV